MSCRLGPSSDEDFDDFPFLVFGASLGSKLRLLDSFLLLFCAPQDAYTLNGAALVPAIAEKAAFSEGKATPKTHRTFLFQRLSAFARLFAFILLRLKFAEALQIYLYRIEASVRFGHPEAGKSPGE